MTVVIRIANPVTQDAVANPRLQQYRTNWRRGAQAVDAPSKLPWRFSKKTPSAMITRCFLWKRSSTRACNRAQLRNLSRICSLLQHFCHCGAFFSAIATSFCTGGHLLVFWHFLAGCRTIIATFCTALTSMKTQITLSSTQRCAHLAALGTIHAQVHAFGMLFFPFANEFRTID